MQAQRQYIAIDLKSFYASVECVERGLNPLDACLVVADPTRTDKTICLAVSPALKFFGVPGRPRLFEVNRILRNINRTRSLHLKSTSGSELMSNPDLTVDYIVAPPRMQLYVDYSTKIYSVYLRYIAPEDIHVYSIDEVFIDATAYLETYGMTAHQLAMTIIRDVLRTTGITATAGIGTNLYLCKIAMDIVAKKMKPDADGVRIAELDEMSYRKKLWNHRPLTDFWRIGHGTARRLAKAGIFTMGDVARYSITHEDWFYKTFGINAELLIDHAWGWEPVEMHHIKSYRPETRSLSSGQVLSEPYTFDKAKVVILEMANAVSLDLVDKGVVTNQVVLTIGYDHENLTRDVAPEYKGNIHIDHYGRPVPEHAHGTINLHKHTNSERLLTDAVEKLFDRITDPALLIRRLNITTNNVIPEYAVNHAEKCVQLDLFNNYEAQHKQLLREREEELREHRRQNAIINIKKAFGKNAILKGINYAEGATQRERNQQIGGHKA